MSEIKAVVLDIDGVFTNGTVSIGPEGDERKSIHFADIMGVARTRKKGIVFGLISGEGGLLVDRIAEKLGITDVTKNCKTKDEALKSFAERNSLPLQQIAFVGDDVNDVEALKIAGYSASPQDAQPCALAIAKYIAKRKGGEGAVREILETLIGPV